MTRTGMSFDIADRREEDEAVRIYVAVAFAAEDPTFIELCLGFAGLERETDPVIESRQFDDRPPSMQEKLSLMYLSEAPEMGKHCVFGG